MPSPLQTTDQVAEIVSDSDDPVHTLIHRAFTALTTPAFQERQRMFRSGSRPNRSLFAFLDVFSFKPLRISA